MKARIRDSHIGNIYFSKEDFEHSERKMRKTWEDFRSSIAKGEFIMMILNQRPELFS